MGRKNWVVKVRDGQFGENLTLRGIDINDAEVGEWWRVGSVTFEVAMVRMPVQRLQNWQRIDGFDDRAWVKRFARVGQPAGPISGSSRRVSCRPVRT